MNIPFVIFTDASPRREHILELLGARRQPDGSYDPDGVFTLCLFCNGPWCDQPPRASRD